MQKIYLGLLLGILTTFATSSAQVHASLAPAPMTLPLTVTGKWQFRDRGNAGWIAPRGFWAELWPAAGSLPFSDSRAPTDSAGNFSLTTNQYTGGDVRVALYAQAPTPGDDIFVQDPLTFDNWFFLTGPFNPGQVLSFRIPFSVNTLPALWIMDDFKQGFVKIPVAQQAVVRLRARWGPDFESIFFGQVTRSFFCYGFMPTLLACDGEYIYLFRRDVKDEATGQGLPERLPLHEMGHPVMYGMYGGNMAAPDGDYWNAEGPGPCEGWTEGSQLPGNPDCAWQEGWADWWRLYALGSPVVNYLTGSVDYENTNPAWQAGDVTPGRITGALVDIYDSPADGTDAVGLGFSPIWTAFLAGAVDSSFAQYWSSWKAAGRNQCAATSIYQNTITYNAGGWRSCANAQPQIKVGELDTSGYVRTPVSLAQLTSGGTPVLAPGGVSAFGNKVTYPPGAINVLDVTATTGEACNGVPPPGVVDNLNGTATFSGSITPPAQPSVDLELWYPYLRLYGSALQSYSLTFPVPGQPAQPYTYAATSTGAAPSASATRTYRRGDGRVDGSVDIADRLFVAQYLVGNRALGGDDLDTLHAVNTASVRQDIEGPCDIISIADDLYIAQYLVGLRDEFFNLVGGAAAPSGEGAGAESTTTVAVGSATVGPGQQVQVPVTVSGITDADGLGGYDLKLTFNPQIVNVVAVSGGQPPFAGGPTSKIDNVAGQVFFNATQSALPGPTATIVVAYLTVQAVGAAGTSTPLNLSITGLVDSRDGAPIPSVDVDGTITIQ